MISRLEGSAIALFSSHGFEGTSLRDIAAHADVALSSIDRHFGSKLDIFNEVQRRIWKEINAEREALMKKPLSLDDKGNPTLEALLHAFFYPIVIRVMEDSRGAPAVRLVRETVAMRLHMGRTRSTRTEKEVADYWIRAIMQSCPRLPRSRAVWAYSFVVSSAYSWQLLDGWLEELLPPGSTRSAEDIVGMLCAFCSAGIRAVEAGRPTPTAPDA